ncbi:MAG: hypothetical protein ACOVP7_08595 [Lacibacter sp.]
MKHQFLLFLLFVSGLNAFAQCSNFYYLQPDKTIEMSMTNARGKSTGKIIYQTGNINSNGGTTSSTLKQEVFDEKGKLLQLAENKIKCNGGVMMMDIKSFMNNSQDKEQKIEIKGEDVYIEYPSALKEGATLPDGKASFNSIRGAVITEMEMNITDRKVVAKENIITAAGTWDCYKITYTIQIKTFVGSIAIPIKINATEWFAPGFGVVKTASRFGETIISSIKQS